MEAGGLQQGSERSVNTLFNAPTVREEILGGTLRLTPNSWSLVIQINSHVYTNPLAQVLSLFWGCAAPSTTVPGP